MTAPLTQEQLDELRGARAAYLAQDGIEHYDEVLQEITARAQTTGDLGKADIGALLFWKRLRADTRWVTSLHLTSDSAVRAITRQARGAMADLKDVAAAASAGRSALSELPGFRTGDALAAAVLTALNPSRMAIYDVRAHAGLRRLGHVLDDKAGRYSRYMAHVENLALALSCPGDQWTNRDVDLALFWLGAPPRS